MCIHPQCSTPTTTATLCDHHAPTWRDLAACQGTDLALWFTRAADAVATARDICAGCPVRSPCLTDALEAEVGLPIANRHGIRAGLDPAQRATATPRPDFITRTTPTRHQRLA